MPRNAEYEKLRAKHPVQKNPFSGGLIGFVKGAVEGGASAFGHDVAEGGRAVGAVAHAAEGVPEVLKSPEEAAAVRGVEREGESLANKGKTTVGAVTTLLHGSDGSTTVKTEPTTPAEKQGGPATKPKPGTTVAAGPPAPTGGQKGDTGQAVAADVRVQNDRSIQQAQQNAAKLAAKQASSWTAIEKQAGNNQTTFQTVVQGMGLTPAQAASAWTTVSALGPTYTGDQVTNAIEGSDWFNQAFPGIKLAEANGNPVPDPATYVSYAATARQQAALAGIPPGYFTDAEIGDLIGNGVDQQTLQTRIQDAGKAVQGAITPQAAQYLQSQYGVSQGDLMAVWLNPQANVPLLNSKVQAATIGGAAQLAGYGTIDKGLALSAAENSSSGITNFAQQLEQGAPMLGLEQGGLETNAMEKVAPGTEAAIALNEGTAAQQRAQVMAVGARVGASSGGGGFGTTGRGTGAGSGAEQGAKGDVMQ